MKYKIMPGDEVTIYESPPSEKREGEAILIRKLIANEDSTNPYAPKGCEYWEVRFQNSKQKAETYNRWVNPKNWNGF